MVSMRPLLGTISAFKYFSPPKTQCVLNYRNGFSFGSIAWTCDPNCTNVAPEGSKGLSRVTRSTKWETEAKGQAIAIHQLPYLVRPSPHRKFSERSWRYLRDVIQHIDWVAVQHNVAQRNVERHSFVFGMTSLSELAGRRRLERYFRDMPKIHSASSRLQYAT